MSSNASDTDFDADVDTRRYYQFRNATSVRSHVATQRFCMVPVAGVGSEIVFVEHHNSFSSFLRMGEGTQQLVLQQYHTISEKWLNEDDGEPGSQYADQVEVLGKLVDKILEPWDLEAISAIQAIRGNLKA